MTQAAIFSDITRQTHTLIGGMTGGGKSVVIRGVLRELLRHSPTRCKLVLIDPKKVELHPYRRAPHCIAYADTSGDIADTIHYMCDIMDARYSAMQAQELRETADPHIYIIIDELADLMDVCDAGCKRDLKRILQLGRAAGIHVIAATQHPERRVLPAEIQLNFTAVLALPCKTVIESRQLVGAPGAERLEVGNALYTSCTQRTPRRVSIPMVSDADTATAIDAWTAHTAPTQPTPTQYRPEDTPTRYKSRTNGKMWLYLLAAAIIVVSAIQKIS